MPLPCPQVLCDFLDLYLNTRGDETWGTTLGRAKSGTQRVLSFFTGKNKDDDATYKGNVCKILKANFNVAKSVESWITIINQLASMAEEEQAYTNNESLACLTFHAARSYIVRTITSMDDEACHTFVKYRDTLIAKRDELIDEISDKRINSNGIGVKPLKEQLDTLLINLSYLGDQDSIFMARDFQLLSHLRLRDQVDIQNSIFKNDINEEIPFCLQDKFCKILYSERFQQRKNISFEEFEIKSIEEYKKMSAIEKAEREKEAEKIANLKQQLTLVYSEAAADASSPPITKDAPPPPPPPPPASHQEKPLRPQAAFEAQDDEQAPPLVVIPAKQSKHLHGQPDKQQISLFKEMAEQAVQKASKRSGRRHAPAVEEESEQKMDEEVGQQLQM